jgi:hypothetical protein
VTKFVLRRHDPVVEPGQEVVPADPLTAKTENDLPDGEFGNAFLFSPLDCATLAGNLKELRNARA